VVSEVREFLDQQAEVVVLLSNSLERNQAVLGEEEGAEPLLVLFVAVSLHLEGAAEVEAPILFLLS
jgi:hypothetical protein